MGISTEGLGVHADVETRLDDMEDEILIIGIDLRERLRDPVNCVEIGVSCFFSRNRSYRQTSSRVARF